MITQLIPINMIRRAFIEGDVRNSLVISAEPIEMAFGLWNRVGPTNHVGLLDAIQIPISIYREQF